MEQPAIANKLGATKAKNIASLNVDVVAMGNIGCMVQIQNHLACLETGEGRLKLDDIRRLLNNSASGKSSIDTMIQ